MSQAFTKGPMDVGFEFNRRSGQLDIFFKRGEDELFRAHFDPECAFWLRDKLTRVLHDWPEPPLTAETFGPALNRALKEP